MCVHKYGFKMLRSESSREDAHMISYVYKYICIFIHIYMYVYTNIHVHKYLTKCSTVIPHAEALRWSCMCMYPYI